MLNRKYPTVHYFPKIIESGSVYVDKTQFVVNLLENTAKPAFFLSRPRRFGKSMFVSVLEHVFLGKKDLFKGLYIYDKIKWEDYDYPVIRLSMDRIHFTELGLETALVKAVQYVAEGYSIRLKETSSALIFQELLKKLNLKYKKQVVVLVDEYDKPIIYYIENDNSQQAEANRDILKKWTLC